VASISGSTLGGNRDFQILCGAQGLSRLGTQISAIAFPLLVLRVTGSPSDAGIVACAEGIAMALVLLPGGAIADRVNRRAVMIIGDIGCLLTMGLLAVAIIGKTAPMELIVPAAAVVAGLGASSYAASAAAFRLVLSDSEMTAAVSVSQARNAAIALAGPLLGGLLFGIMPSLPFIVDTASYGACLAGTLAIRSPLPAPEVERGGSWLLKDTIEGLAFVGRHKFIRFTLVSGAVLNFAFTGVLLGVIVTIVKSGGSSLATGAVIAFAGLGSLLGSLLAPAAKDRLSLRQAVLLVTWLSAILVSVMAVARQAAVLALLLGACALAVPALNVITQTVQTLLTPDRMQGRVSSATSFIALSITPIGSVTAGYLLAKWHSEVAFAVFGAILLLLALASTVTKALAVPADLLSPPRHLDRTPAEGLTLRDARHESS
jgi:MFS family permease